ncbi:MAG: hypothetical protein ACE37J_03490 [Pikeienuella sp.]|uniref:hypothetical protein n=1 Tax=Pikeienuella sp. TaxID=2831957 RepID=UPI00391B445B
MKRIAGVFAAGALLAASSCTTGPAPADLVIQDYIDPNYQPEYVSVFAGAGGEAAIIGATRDGAGPEEIAAAIQLPAYFNPRTIRAATTARTGPHLVLVIAPESGATPRKACSGEARGGVAGPELRILGAFCSSAGRPVTEAMFVAAGSPVPSDPDFGRRLTSFMAKLTPPSNPDFQGSGGPFRRGG